MSGRAGPGWSTPGTLALSGYASLRVDFSGWGESPDLGHAPGRPYDQHGIGEVRRDRRRARGAPGIGAIVLAGLCAGAWIGAARRPATSTSRASSPINPQMYWRPGYPVEANIVTETQVRRLSEIRRHKRLGRARACGRSSTCSAPVRRPRGGWTHWRVAGRPSSPCSPRATTACSTSQDRTGRAWRRARRGGRIDATDRDRHRPPDAPALAALVDGGRDLVVARHGVALPPRPVVRPTESRGTSTGRTDTGPDVAPTTGRRRHGTEGTIALPRVVVVYDADVHHPDGARRGGQRHLPDRLGG